MAFEGSHHEHVNVHRLLAAAPAVPTSTIDCGGQTCMRFTGATVRVSGVTFQNAYSATQNGSAWVVPAGANHTLTNVAFVGNTAAFGGAIDNAGILTLVNCVFYNNTALLDGGALSCQSAGASVAMTGTTVMQNTAGRQGGGLAINQCGLAMSGSGVSWNLAGTVGGGASLTGLTGSVAASTFASNTAKQSGGGLFVQNSDVTIIDSQVTGGAASSLGAGIYSEFTSLSLRRTVVSSNTVASSTGSVTYAGGLYCLGNKTLTIDQCSFDGNRADMGAALSLLICSPVITASNFSQNAAASHGGAAVFLESAAAQISKSAFERNAAVKGGGAISMQGSSTVAMTQCTMSGNRAFQGGALEIMGATSAVSLHGVAMTQNQAMAGGGVFWDLLQPSLANVSFAGNAAPHGPDHASTVRTLVYARTPHAAFTATSGSAVAFANAPVRVALFDAYNQTIAIDNASTVAVESDAAAVSGTLNYVFATGQADAGLFAVTATPGSVTTIRFRAFAQGQIIYSPLLRVAMRTCVPGEYQSAVSSLCSVCAAGSFSTTLNQPNCTLCPAGSFSGAGATACQPCAPGTVAPSDGSATCALCAANSIAPFPGSSACTTCVSDSSSDEQRLNCICQAATYAYELPPPVPYGKAINFTCEPCPVGADCRLQNQTRAGVAPLAGYYPDIGNRHDMFIKCMYPAACVGGAQVCATTYTGPLCSACEAGFHVNSDWTCSSCPNPTLNALRIVGVAIAILVGCFLSVYMAIASAESEAATYSIIIKVVSSAVQFNALAVNFNFRTFSWWLFPFD
jgi:hypothetical protein